MTNAETESTRTVVAGCLRRLAHTCQVARVRPVSAERRSRAVAWTRAALEASSNTVAVELSCDSMPGWQLYTLAMVMAHDVKHMAEADGVPRGLPVAKIEATLERLGYAGVCLDRRSRIVRRRFVAIDRTLSAGEVRLGPVLREAGGDTCASRRRARDERGGAARSANLSRQRASARDVAAGTGEAPARPRTTALRSHEDFFAAAAAMARTVMGIEDGPREGWADRRRDHNSRRRLSEILEHGDHESVEDLRRMLGRISRYERRHPSTPTATLGTALGVTARQRFVMWILLVDRMHCSDELLGYSPGQLANLLGYERPADVSTLCQLLGRDGPFVREGYVRHLEDSCRLIDSRLTITDTFAQAMLGEGVSLAPFVGGRSERAQSHLPPWMGRRSESRSRAPDSAPPPQRPLVLSEAAQALLRRAMAQVPLRKKIAEEMGYGALIGYGLGSVFLFEGAPGTGKTLAASVVAHELGRPLLKVAASQLLNAYVGGTESKIQEVFGEAKKSGAVLLIDEADSLLGAREQAVRSWEVSQVNTLLHCIELFEGVVVLTTNFVGRLDKALERRLSLRLRFERPGPKERHQIWRALVGDRFHVEPKYLEEVARAESMTGSQIKTAVLELAMVAIERPNRSVTREDLVLAVQRATQATSSMSTELVAGF